MNNVGKQLTHYLSKESSQHGKMSNKFRYVRATYFHHYRWTAEAH